MKNCLTVVVLSTLSALTLCLTFDKRNSDAQAQPWLHHRLPSYIVPECYDLLLNPPFDGNSFTGTVTITVTLKKPSNFILVHTNDLKIRKTEVRSNYELIPVEDTFYYEPNNYWVVKLSKQLPIGKYKIYFEFEGTYTSFLVGLYKSSYLDAELKQDRFIIATMFEPTEARRAFPCFDEPIFRAEFRIRIVHEKSHFPLSNAPVKETKNIENNLMETTFKNTLPMPTYLVCIIISDFKYQETISQSGVKIRVYSTAYSLDKTDYALETASKVVSYFEDYFGIPYPLPKLDMVGIPDSTGGMENWGLIVYEEKNLLWDKESSILERDNIIKVVSHEIAHMWFGDLVTLKWWDDVWLKEGLASYTSAKAIQHVDPIKNMENQFATSFYKPALTVDSNVNSHPILSPVTTAEEANDLFDVISYYKGASILRMLEHFMGDDFRTGLTAYLKKYYLSSAATEDLWAELTSASKFGLNISGIMDTWTKQMNYPYISVTHDDSGNFEVQQHRYLEDPESASPDTQSSVYNYVWQIPLTYRTAELKENDVIVINTPEKVSLTLPKSDWVKFNVNSTGFYLVNYGQKDWDKFSTLLQTDPNIFDPTDRLGFIIDSFYLASGGVVNYAVPLNISLYLKKETEFEPWSLVQEFFNNMLQKFRKEREIRDLLRKYIRSLVKDLLKEYTWADKGDYSERKLRSLLIDLACDNGDKECLRTALNFLKDWMKGIDISSKVKSIKTVLYYGVQADNSKETFDYLWQRYLDEQDPILKNHLLTALANVRDETLLERLLTSAENENIVRRQDYFPLLRNIALNTKGSTIIFNFTMNNWSALNQRFQSKEVEKFGAFVFGLVNSEKKLKRVENFYNSHPAEESNKKTRAKVLDEIRENISWLHRHELTIFRWLLAHVNSM